ncbi:hypothetical protein TNCV_4179011 [Trichonephila clavipes]|nr:hypothetical protein TNCV_4179011 [Trichonephila clavipes]
MARKRAENREGSLGFPGFVKPVFTKDSKPLGRRKKITRAPRERETRTHLKKWRNSRSGAEAHEMSRSGGQSEAKPPVFSPQASVVLIYQPTEGMKG